MKKLIRSTEEIPNGYLTTNKFNAPFIRTDGQRNALEALEIAISQKFKQFNSMCDIQFHLTSAPTWSGTIDEYDEGYYIQLEATRSSFQAFVQNDTVIRKPRNLSNEVTRYRVYGEEGQVTHMTSGKDIVLK